MAEIEIFSPAKINLLLAVTGKRADGFHALTSLVAPLAFGDRIRIEVDRNGEGIELESNLEELPLDEANIAWQAARRFLDRFEVKARVRVNIEKRIPVGAGLGGGSSNGTSVLMGLSKLFEISDFDAVLEIAASLGSDCPLFLKHEPLIMRGRGELIESLDPSLVDSLRGRRLVLFKPSFGISTVWAYKSLAANSEYYAEEVEIEATVEAWKRGECSLDSLLLNSFDEPVGRKYPSIPLLLERIRDELGVACLMSGSGSCCFALCDESETAGVRKIVQDYWGERAFFEATRILDI